MNQRTAFVTGAGRGIGRAIAKTLALRNMKIVVADFDMENAGQTVSAINEEGGEAIAVYCDITNLQSVQKAVETATSHYQCAGQ